VDGHVKAGHVGHACEVIAVVLHMLSRSILSDGTPSTFSQTRGTVSFVMITDPVGYPSPSAMQQISGFRPFAFHFAPLGKFLHGAFTHLYLMHPMLVNLPIGAFGSRHFLRGSVSLPS